MTPEENLSLARGGSLLPDDLTRFSINMLLYAVYLSVFTLSTRTLLLRAKRSQNVKPLLIISALLLVCVTENAILRLSIMSLKVDRLLMRTDLSIDDRHEPSTTLSVIRVVQGAVRFITLMLSDVIAIWRAWVLYPHSRLPRFAMVFLLVLNIILIISATIYDFTRVLKFSNLDWMEIFAAVLCLSAATNLTATGLIARKAWSVRRAMGKEFITRGSRPITRILYLLVETGLAFGICQVSNAIVDVVHLRADAPLAITMARSISDESVLGLSAIFPVLVILLVKDQGSVIETACSQETNQLDILSPMFFAAGTPTFVERPDYGNDAPR